LMKESFDFLPGGFRGKAGTGAADDLKALCVAQDAWMKRPLAAMEGFYGMDAAETFFFVVENAVTIYGLHLHPLSAAHGVGGEEIFQGEL